MLMLKYVLNSSILICLFCLGCHDANSYTVATSHDVSSYTVATSKQNQPGFLVSGGCHVSFEPKTSEVRLVSPITVGPQSRTRCIIRINASNAQKQVRLVPLALKGEVKKAPATVAISSILIGAQPTSLSKTYTSPTKFDLTNQIHPTDYTTKDNSTFGINLVLRTTAGELELTDMKFALQQR